MAIVVASPSELTPLETDEHPTETYAALLEMASRKCGDLPPELLVDKAIHVSAGADWPVARAAMQALLRRLGFAERDELIVARRPERRRRLGFYTTGRRGRRGKQRPYRTILLAVAPARGVCDCPDFLRSSLGLCKHLLVALSDVYAGVRTSCHSCRRGPIRVFPW